GAPTVFYKDVNRHSLRRADQIRHDQWTGWRLGEKWALIWGARTDLVTHRGLRERMVERYLHRCISLDAFELDDDRIAAFIHRMKRFNPKMILGYANALHRVAEFVLEGNLQVAVQPRGIVSSAETLTTEAKERVSLAFECPVLDRYGSREVGLIASDCGAGDGLHINADNLVVEIVCGDRHAEPGETGDVIVTDLLNYGMPFIRYDLGDRATASDAKCRCGRSLPLIASVDGRQSDFLIATDGTEVHGEFFTHLFYGHPDVIQFQVVQESREHVVLRIVPKSIDCKGDFSEITETTARVLGNGTEVSVELCDSIAPSRTGKHRFTISKIGRD
ncbi:MAG: hypothetical protein OEM25_07795, partial [Gammaproteobacteria bacterium]|nr:hypothetical protein [Gammaproteobacteria bacterium]